MKSKNNKSAFYPDDRKHSTSIHIANKLQGGARHKNNSIISHPSHAGFKSENKLPLLCNDYEQLSQIGSGSFGYVYKCRYVPTGKFVAVKVFKVKYSSKAKAFENKEVKILHKFQTAEEKRKGSHSPYVMKAIDIIYENGKLHIVFELMELNLTQFIRKRKSESLKRFDEQMEIKVIAKQLLMGMQYLNEELGIMHRDIKPDNIMVNTNPLSIKIIDFGTSKDCV